MSMASGAEHDTGKAHFASLVTLHTRLGSPWKLLPAALTGMQQPYCRLRSSCLTCSAVFNSHAMQQLPDKLSSSQLAPNTCLTGYAMATLQVVQTDHAS